MSSSNTATATTSPNINVAFVVSYVGTPFKGSQLQGHHHPTATVEGLLLVALDKVGLINAEILDRYERTKGNRGTKDQPKVFRTIPPTLGLGRTSRTDRGVSALCNIFNMYCSEKVFRSFESDEKMIEAINKAVEELSEKYFIEDDNDDDEKKQQYHHRHPLLVIQGVQEVPKNFFGRFCANRRVYRYLIPAFALDPPRSKMLSPLAGSWTFEKKRASTDDGSEDEYRRVFTSDEEKQTSMTGSSSTSEDDFLANSFKQALDHYATRAAKANEVLQKFQGYHRFHNYTGKEVKSNSKMETNVLSQSTLHASDSQAIRKIHRAEVVPVPLMIKVPSSCSSSSSSPQYLPHYVFQIDGGSFLLHMIRKIVGITIAVTRGQRDELVDLSLSPEKLVNTPMAPARYLCQTRVFFESYEQLLKHQFTKIPFLSQTIDKANARMDVYEKDAIFSEMVNLDVTGQSLYPAHPPDEIMDPHNYQTKEQQDLLQRQKKNQQQKSALETVSEMRRFVRLCQLHNWNVQENPERFRPKPKKTEEEVEDARQKRIAAKQNGGGGGADGQQQPQQHHQAKRRQRKNNDDDEDENDECVFGENGVDDDEDENIMNGSDNDEEQQGSTTATVDGEASIKPKTEKRKPREVVWDVKSAWLTVEDVLARNK